MIIMMIMDEDEVTDGNVYDHNDGDDDEDGDDDGNGNDGNDEYIDNF